MQNPILISCPETLVNSISQVIVPPLSALFAGPGGEIFCDVCPIFWSIDGDDFLQPLILFCGPVGFLGFSVGKLSKVFGVDDCEGFLGDTGMNILFILEWVRMNIIVAFKDAIPLVISVVGEHWIQKYL